MSTIVHPKQYNAHPSGIECMDVVERMGMCAGNAVKCLWRAAHKGAEAEDLQKAAFYLDRLMAPGSTALLGGEHGDQRLQRYGERLSQSGHWTDACIFHIIVASTTRETMHLQAARNMLHHFLHHPRDRAHAPRAQLPA